MKKALVVLGVALAGVAWADKVTLKSGTILTGTLVGEQEGSIKFKSDDFGELSIAPDSIVSLVNASDTAVPVAEIPPIPKEPETWHGSVNVAFNAARGNTHNNTAAIVANVNRRWESDRLTVDFGYYYSENGKTGEDLTKTEDRWDVAAKHDHFWLPKVYGFETVRWERDMIQGLTSRYRAGLGMGYQWLENYEQAQTGTWSFNQDFGLEWIKERYDIPNDAEKDGYCSLLYAHHLKYLPKWNLGIEIFHNAEILPQVDDWEKYLVSADLGFSTKLILSIDLLAKVEWDFNSQPADGRKKSDIRYIVGLGYKW